MSTKKKEMRTKFNEVCMKRDKGKCKICGNPATEVHHIVDRTEIVNGGYVLENGISLCNVCHMDAERYHITGGREWVDAMHPDDLYRMIGSSHEKALKASERL